MPPLDEKPAGQPLRSSLEGLYPAYTSWARVSKEAPEE